MKTRLGRLSELPMSIGAPHSAKAELFAGTHEARLGRSVGMTQFGVNHITLEPGSMSSLRHWHEGEDEFVYVLSGEVALIDDNGEHTLMEGCFAGFPAGAPNAHHLANKSEAPATFIVVGTRMPGRETVHYPDDEIGSATVLRDAKGERIA